MKTTLEFLDAVKTKHGLPSDYALSIKLDLTRSSISRFKLGKDFLGDETAMKVAHLLDLDPAYVVACIHAERAKKPAEKQLWERMAMNIGALGGVAATVLIVLALPYSGLNSGLENVGLIGSIAAAGTVQNDEGGKCILCQILF